MLDVLLDTLLDTLKLLPFLYLSYLLMEFLEHRSGGAAERWLRRSGKVGPLIGGLLGILPQCGFSAAASGLYTGRIITAGTLISVYLATSDEMLPIFISEGVSPLFLIRILAAKFLIGMVAGFAVDFVSSLLRKRFSRREQEPQIEDLCEREHCHCETHFALSALRHTLHITVFLLLFSFCMNTLVYLVGEETIAGIVLDRPILGCLLSAVVGLIPNCASSVILTQLYLGGVLSVGAMMAGLSVNAGVGLVILFRNNRPVRDTLRILLLLFCIGTAAGILIDLTPLAAFLAG